MTAPQCKACGTRLDADGMCPVMREQAREIAAAPPRPDPPGMCPWCAAMDGHHETYCSVYDDPLTNYSPHACEECRGRLFHVEGCSMVEREVKFVRRDS